MMYSDLTSPMTDVEDMVHDPMLDEDHEITEVEWIDDNERDVHIRVYGRKMRNVTVTRNNDGTYDLRGGNYTMIRLIESRLK